MSQSLKAKIQTLKLSLSILRVLNNVIVMKMGTFKDVMMMKEEKTTT